MPDRQSSSWAETQADKADPVLPAITSSSLARPFSATMPVANTVEVVAVAAKNAVSSTPRVCTPASRAGSSTSGVPYSRTAAMIVAQPTPKSPATAATVWPSCPTRRHASRRARSVIDARGRTSSLVSVHVTVGHAGSWQRQTRFTHTSVTGRPAAGRSRTQLGRRSCSRACTPQPGHQPCTAVVSTACSTSPPYSDTANTVNPDKPSITVVAIPSSRTWDLL